MNSFSDSATTSDLRIEREKAFHDEAFATDKRAKLKKISSFLNAPLLYYRGLLLGSSTAEAQVLEYGCGVGGVAFEMARAGHQVTGIDISPVAIQKATERAQQAKLNNIYFTEMNAEDLSFNDKSMDIVCGSAILHHLNIEQSLKEIARVLKPEGKAVFLEPLAHNPLLRLFRWLTPSLRTPDEHPLTMKDIEGMRSYFGHIEIKYFHLLTLMAIPFYKFPFAQHLGNFLTQIDQFLFKHTPLRRYAWQVVLLLKDPKKNF